MELNKEGFVIKDSAGVTAYSHHSALSGVAVGSGAVTVPVFGVPGLYYRLAAGEGRATPDQITDIEARAKAWFAARQPAPSVKPSSRRVFPVEDEKSEE
jgi:hypothetical protein